MPGGGKIFRTHCSLHGVMANGNRRSRYYRPSNRRFVPSCGTPTCSLLGKSKIVPRLRRRICFRSEIKLCRQSKAMLWMLKSWNMW